MPSSFDINQLRAGAPSWAAPLRAHDKENSFAPAMVSQAETRESPTRGRSIFSDGAAGCRSSNTD
jgi:hypothetical protein